MFTFLKYMLELILSPGEAWKDVAVDNHNSYYLSRSGLYPMMVVAAATEFMAFFYHRHVMLGDVIIDAILDFGAYFVALFVARLIFEMYMGRLTVDGKVNKERANNLIVIGMGLMVLIRIICNLLPWNLVLLQFMPLYVVLVLYKAIPYMNIAKNHELGFVALSSAAIVGVPLLIYYLLYLVI